MPPARLRPPPRPDGRRATARRNVWVLALLAALAVMLSHGLDSETPTEHHSPLAHAAAHHQAVQTPAGASTTRAHTSKAAAPDDSNGAHQGTHICLAAHPPQKPSLSGPWHASGPTARAPRSPSSEVHGPRQRPAGGHGPPAGIQVLRV